MSAVEDLGRRAKAASRALASAPTPAKNAALLTAADLLLERAAEIQAANDLDLEAALGYARSVLSNTSKVWEVASAPRKRSFQTLIFPEGVTFDGKGLGTPTTTFIFSLLGAETYDLEDLVEQKGFEPSTPTLRTWCSPS